MVNQKIIQVKVVYATTTQHELILVELPINSTVEQAINESEILHKCDDIDLSTCALAIFGKIVERTQVLKDQDRVEILRPLIVDPMHARRKRAQLQH